MTDFYESEFPTLHRTAVERYSICPRQARLSEIHGYAAGNAAASGNEIHTAISRVITDYLDSGGQIGPADIRDSLWVAIKEARPDVQPDAIKGLRPSMWPIGELLNARNPADILRYDGGEGDRTGQIATRVEQDRVILTSELDLLMTTASAEMLDEIDWKTGWKFHTAESVASSFQFQMHAWLVMEEYREVHTLRVRVWNTRNNTLTPAVVFERRDHEQRHSRVMMALGEWYLHRGKTPALSKAWPTEEKCRICPGLMHCDAGTVPVDEASPTRALQALVVLNEQRDRLKTALWAHVESTGEDIVLEDGTAFGWEKPAGKRRKPTDPVYKAPKRAAEPVEA